MALWDPTTLAERLAAAREVLALVEQVEDPSLRFWGYFRATVPFMEQGDFVTADDCVAACGQLSDDLGQPVLRWYASALRSTRALIAGRIVEAGEMAEEAFAIGRVARPKDALLFYLFQLFGVRFEQGRLGEIEEQIDEGARVVPMPLIRPLSVLVLCELGRDDEAIAALHAADLQMVPVNLAWMHTMAIYASVAAYLGDRSAAAVLRELLSPFADQVVAHSVIGLGAASHFLGMLATTLGYHDEADARFAEAAATHARVAAPAWLARTRLEWARMLLTRRQPGDADRARELLSQALTAARDLGLRNVERRAVALLQ
jgi:tetratricopeptide (TPR) repeat protein